MAEMYFERRHILRTARLAADVSGREQCVFLVNGVWHSQAFNGQYEGPCVVIRPRNRPMAGWRTLALNKALNDRHYGRIDQEDVENMVAAILRSR